MKQTEVTVVRVYLTEREGLLESLLQWLHDRTGVRGVTVFRGISGFGSSGTLHGGGLLDLSLDLPLVVEFFDEPDKIEALMSPLLERVAPEHVIRWSARLGV